MKFFLRRSADRSPSRGRRPPSAARPRRSLRGGRRRDRRRPAPYWWNVQQNRRDFILAGQQGAVEIGRHRRRERRHVGAEIGDGLDLEPGDLALGVERHLRMGDMVAAMGVGEKRLRTLRYPSHRPADFSRSPEADHLLRIDEDLEPKLPPTSGAITRSLCSGAMPTKAEMTRRATGFCGRVPEREAVGAGVVFADRHAARSRSAPGGC